MHENQYSEPNPPPLLDFVPHSNLQNTFYSASYLIKRMRPNSTAALNYLPVHLYFSDPASFPAFSLHTSTLT